MQPRPNKCKLNAGDRARRRFVGSAGRIAASTAAVGSGRRRSAPVVGPRTRDLWSHNRRRAVARATGTTTAAVAANGGGGSPSSVVRWCLVAVSVVVLPLTERVVVGSPPSRTTRVPTSVGHPYRRRAVVARPAAAPPTSAQRNRHGNRSPLPLTNPFGTADRPLTPPASPLSNALPRRLPGRSSRHIIRTRLFQPFSTHESAAVAIFWSRAIFFNSSLFVGILG